MKEQLESLIKTYLKEQIEILIDFPVLEISMLVKLLYSTYKKDGVIFLFGNGGGASIASHFAGDLGIHPFVSEDKHSVIDLSRLKVHCLNDSDSLITRLGNDIGFEYIFTEQLRSHKLCADDMLIAFSASGNSPNIINAVSYGNSKGAYTVLIGGRDGGKAGKIADMKILVPNIESKFPGQVGKNNNCFHIEDFQTAISHMITGLLKEVINA